MMTETQLPLNLQLHDDAVFDNFLIGKNQVAVQALQHFAMRRGESFIYCYGESGVGCTHLLQACCHLAFQHQLRIFYLPLSHYQELSIAIFSGLEHNQLVCFDDLDAIAGDALWEESLFHFYNRVRDNKLYFLVSAKKLAKHVSYVFPDLQSRLSSGLSLEIQPLNDAEKISALQMRAKNRGLLLSDEVSHYLLNRFSRNMSDLLSILEKLDCASLSTKRKLTIPFVKLVMDI